MINLLKLILSILIISAPFITLKASAILMTLDSYGYYEFQKQTLADYNINQDTVVNKAIQNVSVDHMNLIISHLSSYHTRYYLSETGLEAFTWMETYLKELTQSRSDIFIEKFNHKNHNQPTLIVTIPGVDEVYKNEIIIIGAHGDSINTNSSDLIHAVAPGADDNAGGVAVVFEIIRKLVETNYKPLHTLQFIIYAAEEPQDRGSYELTKFYRENQIKVTGVLNFDGVGYKAGEYDLVLIDDSTTYQKQNVFLGQLIDRYLNLKWTYNACNYACSDHHSWTLEGYRASFPFETELSKENPHIHSENDTFDKIGSSADHALHFVKLGLAYIIELDR